MTIAKNYDKILSMIIDSDKKNKTRIKCFIESIPEQLIIEINNYLNLIRNNYDEEFPNIANQFEVNNKILYWYVINSNIKESIDIGYSIYNGEKYTKVFEITLINYTDKELNDNNNLWLGKIEYNVKEYEIEDKTYIESIEQEYKLVKNKLGTFILSSKNGNFSSINKVKTNKLIKRKY